MLRQHFMLVSKLISLHTIFGQQNLVYLYITKCISICTLIIVQIIQEHAGVKILNKTTSHTYIYICTDLI